jgi:hypothetical protein
MPATEQGDARPDFRVYLEAFARARQQYEREPTPHHHALLRTGELILYQELEKPGKVALGYPVMTPGALEALRRAQHIPPEFLLRHKHGDWGELDPEDVQTNEYALRHEQRLLSAYRTRRQEKLWVITEWDRSVTTLLLPDEY